MTEVKAGYAGASGPWAAIVHAIMAALLNDVQSE